MQRTLVTFVVPHAWLLSTLCLSAWAQQPNDLFELLSGPGLKLTNQLSVPLAPPALAVDSTPEERTAKLHGLAGKQPWDRFIRDSIMAPVTIDIDAIQDAAGQRVGHDIHNAFIVHANLEKLRDARLMEQIFGRPGQSTDTEGVVMQELDVEDLRQLGIEPSENESYAYLEMPLLNKVLVRGVIHIQKRERAGAYEFVWQLDPHIEAGQYAARWTQLERNSVGRVVPGETHPYRGCGGFMGVYELGLHAAPPHAKPAGSQPDSPQTDRQPLLVESRMILHEPQEWFAGSNFLRSKLPLSMQENARSFRRKLEQD